MSEPVTPPVLVGSGAGGVSVAYVFVHVLPELQARQGVFYLHVGSFAAYNALVGYLLVHREEGGLASLAFFALAMALHFVVNGHGLRDHHRKAFGVGSAAYAALLLFV